MTGGPREPRAPDVRPGAGMIGWPGTVERIRAAAVAVSVGYGQRHMKRPSRRQ